jgi:uncharacterized damage-inducible protein DinB
MTLIDALLPEYDHETALTRKLLERLPEGKLAWKPHQKSMSLGRLASHLGETLLWLDTTVNQSEYDMVGDSVQPTDLASKAEILAYFDRAAASGRAALAGSADAVLMQPWAFKRDGQVVFSMPKVAAIRSMVMNHLIHHRGQFSVYLRQNDVPLPGIYGPSADERL